MADEASDGQKHMEIDNIEEERPNQKDNDVTNSDLSNEIKDLTNELISEAPEDDCDGIIKQLQASLTFVRGFLPEGNETFSAQMSSKFEELKATGDTLSSLMPHLTYVEKLPSCDEGLGLDLENPYDIESSESENTEYYNSETEDEQPITVPGPKRRKLDRRSKEVALKTISGKRTFEEYDASEESDEDPSYVPSPITRTDSDKSSSESSSNDDCEDDSPMNPVNE